MNALVEIKQVVKGYTRGRQRVEVLHALDLTVANGEFLALMGPSGSGKTTLLNLIGGLDRPDSGEIVVAGERIHELGSGQLARWRARNVGFIFQFYNLLPVLTAERNVEVPLLLTSLTSAERKRNVAAALELVGLADRAKHKPSELSGGQQQRVGLARAFAAEPELVLLDEPFGALDPLTRDRLQTWFQQIRRALGLTAVFVTHDMVEALLLGDRIAVLDRGRLLQVGTPAELLREPADAIVAELMATPRRHAEVIDALLARAPGPGGR
jgi:putative ABC transport system ATP-binding protein